MSTTVNTTEEPVRIEPVDLLTRLQAGEAMTIVDVRNNGPWQQSNIKIRGAIRIDPEKLPLGAAWPKDQLLTFY